jgi:hypothetical protein
MLLRHSCIFRFFSIVFALLLFGAALHAQEESQDAVPTAANAVPDTHIFGVLPNYRTAPDGDFQPITWRQKFNIARHDSFDPPGFGIAAVYTAVYHLENTNPEFGQGVKGYLHRYGTTYGDQMIGNMMTEGVMPSLLHEDPRYYRRAHGSIPVRTLYALSRIFVTRTDANKQRFNFSEFAGNAIAVEIASAYYPDERSPGETAHRFATQLMTDSISNCLKEFWPDIKRHFHLGPRNSHS